MAKKETVMTPEAEIVPEVQDTSAPEAPKVPMVLVEVLRAYWPDENTRVEAGELLEVPVSIAKPLIKSGVLARTDPLPGDA